MNQKIELIKSSIKSITNYPKEGIIFRDITSLLEVPEAFQATVDIIAEKFKDSGVTKIVGTESRGFIFGAPIALALKLPFVLVRKPKKLPRATISEAYELEYGKDILEIHADAIKEGDKVLIIDDLLATGGTVEATTKLIKRLGGTVENAAFVICLPELNGVERLEKLGVKSMSIIDFNSSLNFKRQFCRNI